MILGMDLSTLEETEALGGRLTRNGRAWEPFTLLRQCGVDGLRLRLWNDPYAPSGTPYEAGGCDLACVKRLARRGIDAGMHWMLDLHYSDFWCDPSRQRLPKAWEKLSFDALCGAVYAFTRDTLGSLARDGLAPRFVQIGNEITGGMLWPHGRITGEGEARRESFSRLAALLEAGARAVRESSDASIVLHLERSDDNARYREWFDFMRAAGVPFDVIGVSYYPFWHGGLAGLKRNLDDMAARYGKDVMVVETAYPFTGEHYDPKADKINLVINGSLGMADGSPPPYPFTRSGQAAFVRDMLSLVSGIAGGHGAGLYYWEPAWLPLPGSSWASEAARAYIEEEYKPGGNEWANQCLFDYAGAANPALESFAAFAQEEKA